MRIHQRGLTLVELMVTLSVFGMILVLTLWSYVQGVKATRRHNESSDVFRRANAVFGKVSTQLESARILHAENKYVVFHPHVETPLTEGRTYNWSPRALTLLSTNEGLARVEDSNRTTLVKFSEHESLTFSGQVLADNVVDQRPDFLKMTFVSTPPSVTRKKTRSFQKTIILGRY